MGLFWSYDRLERSQKGLFPKTAFRLKLPAWDSFLVFEEKITLERITLRAGAGKKRSWQKNLERARGSRNPFISGFDDL